MGEKNSGRLRYVKFSRKTALANIYGETKVVHVIVASNVESMMININAVELNAPCLSCQLRHKTDLDLYSTSWALGLLCYSIDALWC